MAKQRRLGWKGNESMRVSRSRGLLGKNTFSSLRMHNPFGDYQSDDDEVGGGEQGVCLGRQLFVIEGGCRIASAHVCY